MANIVHSSTGQITATSDVTLNTGFYYVFSVAGTFDSVQLDAVFETTGGEVLVKLNKETITESGTYTFFSPSNKVRVTPVGVGADVFYNIRMAISPTITGGEVSMVW